MNRPDNKIMSPVQSKIVRHISQKQRNLLLSDTEVAAQLGISAQYWYLIRTGRRAPGPKILKSPEVKRFIHRNGTSNGNDTGKKSRH